MVFWNLWSSQRNLKIHVEAEFVQFCHCTIQGFSIRLTWRGRFLLCYSDLLWNQLALFNRKIQKILYDIVKSLVFGLRSQRFFWRSLRSYLIIVIVFRRGNSSRNNFYFCTKWILWLDNAQMSVQKSLSFTYIMSTKVRDTSLSFNKLTS